MDEIKKAGTLESYDSEKMRELARCRESKEYFIRNYIWIRHPDKGVIKFNLFDYQVDMLNLYENNKESIVVASRQMGKTEFAAAYLLSVALFTKRKKNKDILIVSKDRDAASEVFHRIKSMYEQLPSWLVPGVKVYNRTSITFDNGSRIISRATTPGSGRGLSISLLYIDEFAHVRRNVADEFWTSIYPVVSTGGKIIVTSTPNGDANQFYYLWRDSYILRESKMEPLLVLWDQHPDRDEEWVKVTKAGLGSEERWQQEFMCSFLSNARTLINLQVIEDMKKTVAAKIHVEGIPDDVEMYRTVQKGREYWLFVDVSEGVGGDYSVINVFDDKMEQVAIMRSNDMDHETLSSRIRKLSDYFNEAQIFVERNGPGMGVFPYLEKVHDIPDRIQRDKPGGPPGIRMTAARRAKGVINTKNFIERGRLRLNSLPNLNEFRVFKKRGGKMKYEAEVGCHDDMVMTIVMLSSVTDRLIKVNENVYTALYEADETSALYDPEEGLNENTITPGPSTNLAENVVTVGNHKYKMPDPEWSWLYD